MPLPDRPNLPSPPSAPAARAVLGGLLVALAMGLALRLGSTEQSEPDLRYLVLTRAVDVGERLDRADLGTVALDLPAPVDGEAVPADEAEALLGAATLAPLRPGQLLMRADLRRGTAPSGAVELSVPVPVDRALAGRLAPGELVDVLATTGTGADAATEVVASDVRVLGVSEPDDSIARLDVTVLTLALVDRDAAIAVAHASTTAEVTIARAAAP